MAILPLALYELPLVPAHTESYMAHVARRNDHLAHKE
jgi:hypothetical protein